MNLTIQRELGEDMVQILEGDKILFTIGEPVGPGRRNVVAIWEGDGLDENDEEATPLTHFRGPYSFDELLRQAVKEAVGLAIEKVGL